MDDRTLLERAVRAAGLVLVLWQPDGTPHACYGQDTVSWRWNPLEDDGDALRLAVKLVGPYQRPRLVGREPVCRVAPSSGLDDDNLAGALKGVRDEVARWLGVDDRDRMTVRYRYAQTRGPWGVRIEFGEPVAGAQLALEMG